MPNTSKSEPKNDVNVIFEAKEESNETLTLVAQEKQQMLPLVALREGVVFPHTDNILAFARTRSVQAIEEAIQTHKNIALFTQKNERINDPDEKDLYMMGTIATVERILKGDTEVNVLIHAVKRVKLHRIVKNERFSECEVEDIEDVYTDTPQVRALCKVLTGEFKKAVNLGKSVEFLNFMKLMGGVNASELSDQIASTLDLDTKAKQKILDETRVLVRLEGILERLQEEIKILEIEKNITSKTQKKFDKHAKESILRERIRVIQKELGDISDEDEEEQELDALRKTITRLKMPTETKKKLLKEVRRLMNMPEMSSESGYLRTWLETVAELPWGKQSKKSVSLKRAQEILNEDHYGLEEVKDRILEYLAVLQLREQKKTNTDSKRMPTILCFVGAPGVGKTSLGKSIAKSLGREFVKVSLGGIKDEAEIRGHRRTYVGAMPGRIISSMKQAGKLNPVFMLDEVDKIGLDYRGDPSAALLEALDPEQNHAFEDHYIDVPFDLSQVMFIATANTLDTIPDALRDRLEVISYSGYTMDEKFEIAKRYLLPKQLQINAITDRNIKVSDQTLREIIEHYTREAGVRGLERTIGKLIRKVARLVAQGRKTTVKIDQDMLVEFLGPYTYENNLMEQSDLVGVATGMAWTSVGGEILPIEVALIPNKKGSNLILTGKLGKVMQESARAAFTYVQANADKLKVKQEILKKSEIHVHIPEGAVPKDGPSAGITLATAIASALSDRPIKHGIAMTGEITLRGRVLEIGGLKEKVIAAHRAGFRTIIAPSANKKDWAKMPQNIKNDVQAHFVEHMDEVVALVLA